MPKFSKSEKTVTKKKQKHKFKIIYQEGPMTVNYQIFHKNIQLVSQFVGKVGYMVYMSILGTPGGCFVSGEFLKLCKKYSKKSPN